MSTFQLIQGCALEVAKSLPSESVQTCVTSPPYFGLRDYGVPGQIGLEQTPEAYVERLVGVFREVRRVLKDDGTLWLNIGDSYAGGGGGNYGSGLSVASHKTHPTSGQNKARVIPGCKPKDLIGIPWAVAFALRADGWYLRSDIIWNKPNPMPESVVDRPTKSHEYIFLLSKNASYYYDAEAIKEPAKAESADRYKYDFTGARGHTICPDDAKGQRTRPEGKREFNESRNKRSVWTVATRPYADAHFATFPPELITPCVLAGAPEGGAVYDPFTGSGTTGVVALRHGRNFIGSELNPFYLSMARNRIKSDAPLFNEERTA